MPLQNNNAIVIFIDILTYSSSIW